MPFEVGLILVIGAVVATFVFLTWRMLDDYGRQIEELWQAVTFLSLQQTNQGSRPAAPAVAIRGYPDEHPYAVRSRHGAAR